MDKNISSSLVIAAHDATRRRFGAEGTGRVAGIRAAQAIQGARAARAAQATAKAQAIARAHAQALQSRAVTMIGAAGTAPMTPEYVLGPQARTYSV
ncbi:hypothetical protein ABT075_04760 [Streptomyces sp. NPDC002677]|uniref:hypothetical protein n=1 Tax=Streptomyces sp. NPDC002677 TaxID=3154774 RepID=UPI003325B749